MHIPKFVKGGRSSVKHNTTQPLLCLTELLPPFISQTLRDGTPQIPKFVPGIGDTHVTVDVVMRVVIPEEQQEVVCM